MTFAVIIAAYQARPEWLAACIFSIRHSAILHDVEIDLRIGVDGCAPTATAIAEQCHPYWWSPVNVGPYVMRNSLIALAPADAYVIFDADDVMLPRYFELVSWRLLAGNLVGPSRTECTENLRPIEFKPYVHGVCAFRHVVLSTLGGYKAERLAADVDFVARAATARMPVRVIDEPCYLRRRHSGSLTNAATTGRGTREREQARRRMERERLSAGQRVYVAPVTTPLEFRGERWGAA